MYHSPGRSGKEKAVNEVIREAVNVVKHVFWDEQVKRGVIWGDAPIGGAR